MPTCRDIITRAMQKARILAAGETPSADEADTGMDELQNLYEQWGSSGMFGRLTDVEVSAAYTAGLGERIRLTNASVITLPTVNEDTDLPPYDMSFVEVVDVPNGTIARHLYENGAWVEIGRLELSSEAPLSSKGRSGLAACLAQALAEEFGTQISPMVARQARVFKTNLSLKLGGDAARTAPSYY